MAVFAAIFGPPQPVSAQDLSLRPGEAFVTRFSGTTQETSGTFAIDTAGIVGSIIDLRAPGKPPQGQHWIDEPQRKPVTAAEVGQVFAVALDDGGAPNIYLAATSAFGLHRTSDNRDWTPGMWGPGGPGAIYKLDAGNGYRPQLFATVTLNGRPNSGPALGKLAYDKWNRQFFASDLETGMIHRIAMDGSDRGQFDHGTQGRADFFDAQPRRPGSLPPIAFDPNSEARIADCPTQKFDTSPECWNFAASGRRVWGLGVRGEEAGRVRLYYAVWSGPAFDATTWSQASEDDKRNSIWSIGIGPDGSFVLSDVRREFVLPDFFTTPDEIARAGYSHPVSSISFPACGNQPIMVVAERGGIRNLGLAEENPFAAPHESRALRYELDQAGAWRPVGRYDIGFYDRQKDGPPFIRANCAGGIAFGFGYSPAGQVDLSQVDQFVWTSGDSLCSPDGPCNLPPGAAVAQPGAAERVQRTGAPAGADIQGDDSEVHGIQGMRENAIAELAPASAFSSSQQTQAAPDQAAGPNEAYLIDVDINVDAQGTPIGEELLRNDATTVGDIAIYQICIQAPPPAAAVALLPPPPEDILISPSHYRFGSHFTEMSHQRWGSHAPYWSHNWVLSGWHNRYWSHWPLLSHRRWGSIRHVTPLSPGHTRLLSPGHQRPLSPFHNRILSPGHQRPLSPYHNQILSPRQLHRLPLSPGTLHNRLLSPQQPPPPTHNPVLSRTTTHNPALSRQQPPPTPLHNRLLSPQQPPPPTTHDPVLSRTTTHNPALSRQQPPTPLHNRVLSAQQAPPPTTHNPVLSRTTTHSPALSRQQSPPPTLQRPPIIRQPPTIQRPPPPPPKQPPVVRQPPTIQRPPTTIQRAPAVPPTIRRQQGGGNVQ
jgi:hypothetical protein